MSIEVLRPGILSSFQDAGRHGHQHLGIPTSGAMDERSHRLANLIAGNAQDTATLEMTLVGPKLRFRQGCCIAVSGAAMDIRKGDEPLPLNRPLVLQAGDVVEFGRCAPGARAYLAVHGGFGLPRVMGSQSTYIRGGFGGWQGRALRKGDEIPIDAPLGAGAWAVLERELSEIRLHLPNSMTEAAGRAIRVLRSNDWAEFAPDSQAALLGATFTVGVDSERMGYRLSGPLLRLASPRQVVSEGLTFGTVQVPEHGQPIVLMADHQTTGGYPKIAYVISVDLPLLAQMPPGASLRFEATSQETAAALDRRREAHFAEVLAATAPIRNAIARRGGLS